MDQENPSGFVLSARALGIGFDNDILGISTFGEKPDQVGPGHLKELLTHAVDIIPEDAAEETPLFLLATAGMRLLIEPQQTELLSEICSYARSQTRFQIPDCDLHIQVLPGTTEGLYGWIAVNYLLGGFDLPEERGHEMDHHTYGFLDMGGASAQIAYAPNKTEAARNADDLKLLKLRTLNGANDEYRVFVTSWLGFGVNEARKRYIEGLLKAAGKSDTLQDPCLPAELSMTTKGDVFLPGPKTTAGKTPYLVGTGQFDQCLKQTYPLLEKDAVCEEEPCLLNGVHVPAIDFDVNHFVGISEYWHTTHALFEKEHDEEKAYDLNTFQRRVGDFCSMDWKDIKKGVEDHNWGKKVTKEIAVEICFKASWLINILHEGIGIPRVGLENNHNRTKELFHNDKGKDYTNSFQAINKIDDTEVSWTLGKMLLYASSQIPPLSDKSPVGFGSNIPSGIPPDFQYAGSTLSAVTATPKNTTTTPNNTPLPAEDWQDTLFASQYPRRIPGFFLFVLILFVATFLLCGRDRRKSLYRRICRPPSSSSRPHHSHSRKRNKFLPSMKLPIFFRSSSSRGVYYHHDHHNYNHANSLENGHHHHHQRPMMTDPFELGTLEPYQDDDDSEGQAGDNEHYSDDSAGSDSWTGKSSGWATPAIIVGGGGVGGGGGGGGIAKASSGVGGGGIGGVDYFDHNPSTSFMMTTTTTTTTNNNNNNNSSSNHHHNNNYLDTPVPMTTPGVENSGFGLGILSRSGLVGRTENRDRDSSLIGGMQSTMGMGDVVATKGRRSRRVSPAPPRRGRLRGAG